MVNDALSLEQLIKKIVADAVNPLIKDAIGAAIKEHIQLKDSSNKWYNHDGAAKYLVTTTKSLRTYVKDGVVKESYRLNGNPRYKQSDLDAAMVLITVDLKKHC